MSKFIPTKMKDGRQRQKRKTQTKPGKDKVEVKVHLYITEHHAITTKGGGGEV
jgi:hypothetical protein